MQVRRNRLFLGFLIITGTALLVINIAGHSYYAAALGERFRLPAHAWLKPSGYIGQTLGFAAAGAFFFLWLYPLRKKLGSRVDRVGSVGQWLKWHVAAGLLVPLIAATHAGWRFTGLIGLGYAAMFVVFLSGLVGRYLYVRIPRHRDGLALDRDEIGNERERLLFELAAETGLPADEVRSVLAGPVDSCGGLGLAGTVRKMITDDVARRRSARALMHRLARGKKGRSDLDRGTLRRVLRMARREMALAQQVRMLEASQRALRFWHVAHRPLAVTALMAVIVHIAVAILFGATWLL